VLFFYLVENKRITKSKMNFFSCFIFVSSLFLLYFDLLVLAYIVLRVSHDIGALVTYRNTQKNINNISTIKVLMILSIALILNLLIVLNNSIFLVKFVFISITYIHYYIESFMWKQSSSLSLKDNLITRS
jgi:hypothetical protein